MQDPLYIRQVTGFVLLIIVGYLFFVVKFPASNILGFGIWILAGLLALVIAFPKERSDADDN